MCGRGCLCCSYTHPTTLQKTQTCSYLAPVGNPQAAGDAAAAASAVRVFEAVIQEAEAPGQVFITAEATTLALPTDR